MRKLMEDWMICDWMICGLTFTSPSTRSTRSTRLNPPIPQSPNPPILQSPNLRLTIG